MSREQSRITWDYDVDIVVAGSGAAGCAAALSAHLAGSRSILILEKSDQMTGGTTRMAGGGWVWFPRNPFLRQIGVCEPVEDVARLMKDWATHSNSGGHAGGVDEGDVELIEAFARECDGVITALIDNKFYNCAPTEVKDEEDRAKNAALLRRKLDDNPAAAARAGLTTSAFDALSRFIPSYCAEHPFDLLPTGKVLRNTIGGGTAQQLVKAARGLPGCEVRKGSRVVDVIRGDGGAVVGVHVAATDGREFAVRARRGVVFATGGYSRDVTLLNKCFGTNTVLGTCAAPSCTGDFIKIAQRHGIPVPRLDRAWVKQTVLPHNDSRFGGVFFLNVDSAFVVDSSGRRFSNEKHHYQDRAMDMIHNPERRMVFFIFDERARKRYAGPLMGQGGPIPDRELEGDCLISAPDSETLARRLGDFVQRLDPSFGFDAHSFAEGLMIELPRFNLFAESGVDGDFGRGESAGDYGWHLVGRAKDNTHPNKTMMPLRWGPGIGDLHALVLGVSTLDTKSGPRIDAKARILGADGYAIPGLYGAGNCVRSASNYSYWSAGCTISHAIVFGFIAGRHAMSVQGAKL